MANYKLNQTGAQIQADLNLLDNNSATSGQVLTANGNKGVSFTSLNIPSVDQTYNASSTNAQSGTAVASAISNIEGNTIKSTNATEGQFLVANGSGGCSWVSVPNANGQSF